MAYNEKPADRIRRAIGPRGDVTEKKMFGGLAFLLDGKMFCGIVKDELMVRVGPERYEESLAKDHVRPMHFTGRPMSGYVFVEAPGSRTGKAVGQSLGRSGGCIHHDDRGRKPSQPRARNRSPTPRE